MSYIGTKQLRSEIVEYTSREPKKAILIFLVDVLVYLSAIAGAILLENLAMRISCGIVAGLKIASIFVIAHDAAHASFVKNRVLNKIIARLAFLPSYHNYSLWLIAHNKSHHQSTNLQEGNSWSPLSKDEYDNLPRWRRVLEQFYRSPYGIGFYYMFERWWKNKFFPYEKLSGKTKLVYYLDFLLVSIYMAVYLGLLIQFGMHSTHSSSIETAILAFFIPLFVSNYMFGFTVYQHHTHENIPWFVSRNERDDLVNIEKITMHVRFPKWYNLISHNVMLHTAHHIDSRIPLYHLAKAQAVIEKSLGDNLMTVNFTFKSFFYTMRKCKLYDYDNHRWLGFDGIPSTKFNLIDVNVEPEYV